MHRTLFVRILIAFVAAPLLVATSCISPLVYEPSTNLVAKNGEAAVQQDLKTVFAIAVAPLVNNVEFAPGEVSFAAPGAANPWVGYTPGGKATINLAAISKIEVYPNNKCWIYYGATRRFEFIFATVEDAKKCADLLMSLKRHAATALQPGDSSGATEAEAGTSY